MKFRRLRADEIDARISTVNANGISLLLYKDARVDMNILDETVGAENWQRNHEVINDNLFCNVGIKVGSEWIWKQDVGVESYTEKQKGEASDSFKRACFNWGIGRELYTAPFIWIGTDHCTIKPAKEGKFACYDKFKVGEIDYDDRGNINRLTITDAYNNPVWFLGQKAVKKPTGIGEARANNLEAILKNKNVNIEKLCQNYKVKTLADLTEEQFRKIQNLLVS